MFWDRFPVALSSYGKHVRAVYRQRIYYYVVQYLGMLHCRLQRYHTRNRTLRSSLIHCMFLVNTWLDTHGHIQRGTGVLTPPSKNHKIIGFLSNIGQDPLKNHKATKPVFNFVPSLACQQNANLNCLLLAGQ